MTCDYDELATLEIQADEAPVVAFRLLAVSRTREGL